MEITVLGAGAAYPRAGGACSGYLVRGGGVTVWLDAGNGTMSNLLKTCSYLDVDAMVLSHQHNDHIADVIPMMYSLGFDERFEGSIPVIASPGVAEVLRAQIPGSSREVMGRVFRFETLGAAPFEIGGLRFEPFATVHTVETYGMRISEGDKTFVYSADTADFADLPDCLSDADLLICEASFIRKLPVEARGIHLWADEAGTVAAKAEVRRFVITHVWETASLEDAVAEAQSTFGNDVGAAIEGAAYSV